MRGNLSGNQNRGARRRLAKARQHRREVEGQLWGRKVEEINANLDRAIAAAKAAGKVFEDLGVVSPVQP